MPELIEVELYRRALERAVGRPISDVRLPLASYLRGASPEELRATLVGATIEDTSRLGKLALAHLDDGRTLGLRFGMTGRLVVDGVAPIAELEYASGRDDPAWDRFVVDLADGGRVRINDPRRFGRVELDPDTSSLGPDATEIGLGALVEALASSRPVKAVLLDQSRVAGLGNLLVDETLWRAGLHPTVEARRLGPDDVASLRTAMRRTLRILTRRGGSHTGDLQQERHVGGRCPRDGAALERCTVGGRTTYACPLHQRRE